MKITVEYMICQIVVSIVYCYLLTNVQRSRSWSNPAWCNAPTWTLVSGRQISDLYTKTDLTFPDIFHKYWGIFFLCVCFSVYNKLNCKESKECTHSQPCHMKWIIRQLYISKLRFFINKRLKLLVVVLIPGNFSERSETYQRHIAETVRKAQSDVEIIQMAKDGKKINIEQRKFNISLSN